MYGSGDITRLACAFFLARPTAFRECQKGGRHLIEGAEEPRRTLGRVRKEIVGDSFEICCRFLGPTKLHHERDWCAASFCSKREPTAS